jgi:putative endonuclease
VEVGRVAEQRAAEHLRNHDYTIVCRNYKVSGGEIDLIALQEDTLVFVEVRYRQDDLAEESLSESKIASLIQAATRYRQDHDYEGHYRFDFIAISPTDLRHHQDFIG